MKRLLLGTAVITLMVSGNAQAMVFEWKFNGNGGNLGKSEMFLDTGGTQALTAWAINTEEPPNNPQIFQSSGGIGVNCGVGDGCGLANSAEIDNIGDDEGIVFDFGEASEFLSAKVKSLGVTIFGFPLAEAFEIWGTNDGSVLGCTTGGLSCLTDPSTLLASGSSATQDSVSVDLSGNGYYRYLIATVPGGNGDSYTVKKIVASVPEPATIGMLGVGLMSLGFAAYRRRRQDV